MVSFFWDDPEVLEDVISLGREVQYSDWYYLSFTGYHKIFSNLYEEKLRSMLELVSIEKKEILVLGDLNCDYLVNSDNKEIKHIITAFGLKQLVTSPTRITNQSSTLIDATCSNEPQNISIMKVIPAGQSDHEMVGCARKLNNIKHKSRDITCRNF